MSTRDQVIEWLLEPAQPAVRYRALVNLLGRKTTDSEARAALAAVPRQGWARDILHLQRPGGYWESEEDLYRPKYTATMWRFLVLGDLGLTAEDPRMRRTCELFLSQYAREDGGFDTPGSSPSELCVTGNVARTLYRAGYGRDPRVRAAYTWLLDHQMVDGGWHCFEGIAFGRGTLDAWEGLRAFAELPRTAQTPRIRECIEAGAEFFLERRLLRQGKRYVPWYRTHYPNHYYYDFLVGLDMVTRLGYGDDRRLRPALELLEKKRRPDGPWAIDKVHPDLGRGAGYRFRKKPRRFALEAEGQPSKWITLVALEVLRRVEDSGGPGRP